MYQNNIKYIKITALTLGHNSYFYQNFYNIRYKKYQLFPQYQLFQSVILYML